MRKDLQDTLIKNYPKIFTNVNRIECRDGWYILLNDFCRATQAYIDATQAYIDSGPAHQIKATQVKEKFGGLAFYYIGGDDHIKFLSTYTQQLSLTTCEVCGYSGELIKGDWWKVRCDKHRGD